MFNVAAEIFTEKVRKQVVPDSLRGPDGFKLSGDLGDPYGAPTIGPDNFTGSHRFRPSTDECDPYGVPTQGPSDTLDWGAMYYNRRGR